MAEPPPRRHPVPKIFTLGANLNRSGPVSAFPSNGVERILVVDDDADIRETITDILRDEGYAVDAVSDGYEALAYLRSQPAPCLVLLDLMMPGMTGEELVRALQTLPDAPEVSIAVVSAARDVEESAQRMKAVAYLQKPITLDGLLGLVSTHC